MEAAPAGEAPPAAAPPPPPPRPELPLVGGDFRAALKAVFGETFYPDPPPPPEPEPPPPPEPEPEPEPEPVKVDPKAKKGAAAAAKPAPAATKTKEAEPPPPPPEPPEPEPEPEPPKVVETVYTRRLADIDREFAAALAEQDRLESYLVARRAAAAEAEAAEAEADDVAYTPAWRSAGLPPKPSPLALDSSLMAAARLMDPTALAVAHRASLAAAMAPPATMDFLDTSVWGYLKGTDSLRVRSGLVRRPGGAWVPKRSRHDKTGGDPVLSPAEFAAVVSAAEGRRRAQALAMTGAERDAEHVVLRRMTAKLSYATNPRFAATVRLPGATIRLPGATLLAQLPGGGPSAGHGFAIEPPGLRFGDYTPGDRLTATLTLRNSGRVARRLRLLPPASPHFSASLVSYPAGEGRDNPSPGLIAPGMKALVTITFTPDTLGDYADALTVLTDLGGSFAVPLTATRPLPRLSLPSSIAMGHCLAGNVATRVLACTNLGGAGRFRIVADEEWGDDVTESRLAQTQTWEPSELRPHVPGGLSTARGERGEPTVRMAPFTVAPREFALGTSEAVTLAVTFSPWRAGPFARTLRLVCDNLRAESVALSGDGALVAVGPGESDLADDSVTQSDAATGALVSAGRPLFFGPVAPGGALTRRVTFESRTPLPLPFAWAQVAAAPRPPDAGPWATMLPGLNAAPAEPAAPESPLSDSEAAVFTVVPATGTFAPHGSVTFAVTFSPTAVAAFSRLLRLAVDVTSSGVFSTATPETRSRDNAYTQVAEVALEGLGAAVDVVLRPGRLEFPGAIPPGTTVVRTIMLANRSPAVAAFRFLPPQSGVAVAPAEGSIAAGATLDITVSVTPSAPGPLSADLVCVIDHGPRLPLRVVAAADCPRVDILQGVLDFGLIAAGTEASAGLTLRNGGSGEAVWSLAATGDGGALVVTPTSGVIAPGGACDVSVALCGAQEGELRASLACDVQGGPSAHVAVRADVLKPRACLSLTAFSLGRVFLGVPVTAGLTLRNLTRLPAEFGWAADALPLVTESVMDSGNDSVNDSVNDSAIDAITAAAGAVAVAVVPARGTVPPGGEIALAVTFTPAAVGRASAAAMCTVAGMDSSLGFSVDADVAGLTLSYAIDRPAARPALGPTLTRHAVPSTLSLLGGGVFTTATDAEVAEAVATAACGEAADFGELSLGESRTLTLTVANDSAIPAPAEATLARHAAPAAVGAPAGGWAAATGKGRRPQPSRSVAGTLAPRAGPSSPVAAGAGSPKREASFYGSSFAASTLPSGGGPRPPSPPKAHPHSPKGAVTRAIVVARATQHKGPLLSDAHEAAAPFARSAAAHIAAARDETAGAKAALAAGTGVAFTLSRSGERLKPWGEWSVDITLHADLPGEYADSLTVVCGGPGGLTRVIPIRARVLGSPLAVHVPRRPTEGPFPSGPNLDLLPLATLAWGQLPTASPAVAKRFHVTNTGPAAMRVAWDARVFPTDAAVDAWATVALAVTRNGAVRAAVDAAPWPTTDGADSNPCPFVVTPAEAVIAPGATAAFSVSFRAGDDGLPATYEGTLLGHQSILDSGVDLSVKSSAHLEPLRVALSAAVVTPRLELDERSGLEFLASASAPDGAACFETCFALTNAQACTHGLALSTTPDDTMGLLGMGASPPFVIVSAEASVPQDGAHPPGADLPPALARAAVATADGKRFMLPPRSSLAVRLRFCPPTDLMGGRVDAPGRPDLTIPGALRIAFAGGHVQEIPLAANYVYPCAALDRESLEFGDTHPAAPMSFVAVLSNPSSAPLEWRALNDPAAGADAAAFAATPASGRLPARGLGPAPTARVVVTFSPAEERRYDGRLVVEATCGRGAVLSLGGVGSLREPAEVDHRLVAAELNARGLEPAAAGRLMYRMP